VQDRRRAKRFKTIEDITYTKIEGPAMLCSSSAVNNISSGGMSANLSKAIKKGDKIAVDISVPYNDKKANILAKVVWVKPKSVGGNICGIKFLWASSNTVLNDCVEYARETSAA
jgi:Tfp pilus assembly protein PilZ